METIGFIHGEDNQTETDKKQSDLVLCLNSAEYST